VIEHSENDEQDSEGQRESEGSSAGFAPTVYPAGETCKDHGLVNCRYCR
jgi:hypothetical protein